MKRSEVNLIQACKRHLPFAYFNRHHAPPNGRHSARGVYWVFSPTRLVLAAQDSENWTMWVAELFRGIGIRLVTVMPRL